MDTQGHLSVNGRTKTWSKPMCPDLWSRVLARAPYFLISIKHNSKWISAARKFLRTLSLGSGLLLGFHCLFDLYPVASRCSSFYPTRIWRLHKPISPSIHSPKICRSQENWRRISYNPQPSKSTPSNCEAVPDLCGLSRLCMTFRGLYSNHAVPGPKLRFVILF